MPPAPPSRQTRCRACQGTPQHARRSLDARHQAVLDDFVRLSSPQAAFVQDCCEVGPGHSVPAKVVQVAWRSWCEDNGHEAGSSSSFGAKLRAALPGLERVRRRVDGELAWFYQGVSLNVEMSGRVEGHLLCHPA